MWSNRKSITVQFLTESSQPVSYWIDHWTSDGISCIEVLIYQFYAKFYFFVSMVWLLSMPYFSAQVKLINCSFCPV